MKPRLSSQENAAGCHSGRWTKCWIASNAVCEKFMATWIPTTCCGTARNVGKSSAAPAGLVSFAASSPALVGLIPAIEDGIAAFAGETMKLALLAHWRAASEVGPQSQFRRLACDLAISQQIAGERPRFLGKAASIVGAEDDGGDRVLEAEAARCPPTIRATQAEAVLAPKPMQVVLVFAGSRIPVFRIFKGTFS
eukprot:s977_g9.t1